MSEVLGQCGNCGQAVSSSNGDAVRVSDGDGIHHFCDWRCLEYHAGLVVEEMGPARSLKRIEDLQVVSVRRVNS